MALSDGLFSLVLPGSFPPLSDPLLLIPSSPPFALRRCCLCRRLTPRRLLDHLQPQPACLPPQGLDRLLLPLRLVFLLTLTPIRHPVLERPVDDPGPLVRRRRHGRLHPQSPLHPPQAPSQ